MAWVWDGRAEDTACLLPSCDHMRPHGAAGPDPSGSLLPAGAQSQRRALWGTRVAGAFPARVSLGPHLGRSPRRRRGIDARSQSCLLALIPSASH